MNEIQTWRTGEFIDSPKYPKSKEWKDEQRSREQFLVRPSAKGNAICQATDPEYAEWIAERLNLASKLEQLTYDFATGKHGAEEKLRKFVLKKAEYL